ncbi:hypothetical protein AB205_0072120 [Aquarana catesbeiana]|uniref:Uncharacterized protein n=1 Tax=Aquarana catesbeiana TaxID=8400 RepID=A0A2G9Q3L8_AQUCT|nr:hypothetical protein AB205_0072120 [Aquarana catesbeiana]
MQHLGTLPKQTIVPHFQAMFHIYSSAIKYLCAKQTYFFLHRGEKTRRTPLIRGDQRPPTPGKSTQNKQSRKRKTWWKLAPQQVIVMLWIQILSPWKVHRS